MAAPACFSDIGKSSNDLLNRDFYHAASATLEVKSKAPNGVQFTVKGKSDHKPGAIGGSLEAKYTDKASGATVTQTWTTFNALDTKIELDNALANGVKIELLGHFLPNTKETTPKVNIHYKQPNVHARGFLDVLKGPKFSGDIVIGHEGLLAGAEVGYDVQDGKITRYAAALGYSQPEYTASLVGSHSMTVFSASYYHKPSAQVEVGAKATWDSKAPTPGVAMEVASKYKFAADAFAKAKINNQGIAAFAFNQTLRPGVTVGLGLSLDTQRLQESAHKVGMSFTFES